MKTLILNGSPRKSGDTVGLINKLTANLSGEYKIVDVFYSDISPCVDCRYCWNNNGCSINDEMTEIYDYIANCDNVIIASPIYFSQPTGRLLDVCSRFQTYFAAKYFQNKTPEIRKKKGAVILVGGGDGNPDSAYETLCSIMAHINVTNIYKAVGSFQTNTVPAKEDYNVQRDILKLTEFLNE